MITTLASVDFNLSSIVFISGWIVSSEKHSVFVSGLTSIFVTSEASSLFITTTSAVARIFSKYFNPFFKLELPGFIATFVLCSSAKWAILSNTAPDSPFSGAI